MARTSSGNGSFKRSRSGAVASPDGSGSPFKGSGPPSLSPSPVENPAGELSPFKGGGGGGGGGNALRCAPRAAELQTVRNASTTVEAKLKERLRKDALV